MEVLLIRIDHFHDRGSYMSVLKAWIEEIGIEKGRLITMGNFHLLFIQAKTNQISTLLQFYKTKPIDTNTKQEPCIDRFLDLVGRKETKEEMNFKGFLEMNLLNTAMLTQLVIDQWKVEKEWIEDALSTPRTNTYLAWKEEMKNARKERRKRSAQERDAAKASAAATAENAPAISKNKEEDEVNEQPQKEEVEEVEPVQKKPKQQLQQKRKTSYNHPPKKTPHQNHQQHNKNKNKKTIQKKQKPNGLHKKKQPNHFHPPMQNSKSNKQNK